MKNDRSIRSCCLYCWSYVVSFPSSTTTTCSSPSFVCSLRLSFHTTLFLSPYVCVCRVCAIIIIVMVPGYINFIKDLQVPTACTCWMISGHIGCLPPLYLPPSPPSVTPFHAFSLNFSCQAAPAHVSFFSCAVVFKNINISFSPQSI